VIHVEGHYSRQDSTLQCISQECVQCPVSTAVVCAGRTRCDNCMLLRLHSLAGIQGQLPDFISTFLKERCFRVRVGSCLSDLYDQEMGVLQGAILSVTFFILKINSIIKCLPVGVRGL